MNNLISLKNISKSFSNNRKINVLKKINYSFVKGKIYSLVGPSGSGKSTLLNILSMIDKPTTGSLLIGNTPINFNNNSKNDKTRSSKIGIIYQQNNLLSDFTALENVYLASLAANNDKKLSVFKAKNLLKKVGLLKRFDHYPSQLSGGEKQRVSIARALIKQPKILILDDCLSAMDTETEKSILQSLNTYTKNITTIIISHRISSIKDTNNIIVLKNGQIIQEGNHEQLINQKGYYRELYNKQIIEKESIE